MVSSLLDFDRYVVITEDDRPPKPKTARPLRGVKGRGSVVLFNQASMFQLAELGYTITEGKGKGLPTDSDNDAYRSQMPAFDL
ncbi:hypothetical protein GSI_10115 [Ganoderma sinense ZZ0214-1]|uniref:Uncharacterized protein n=1 Tax=Ganoderma sinense ZZ0214-1 TaxID=1077348 RepID=A0A2G8RZQ9_9APHY|nr:hypothetical protein GSI_10115 [Ganoderma sinense ZZ0214-1]